MKRLSLVLSFVLVALALTLSPGRADMSHTVTIKIDGVDVTNYVLFERANFSALADGQPGMANLVLEDPDHDLGPSDIQAGMTLELLVDGTREWDGWVFKVGRGWPFEADDTTVPSSTPRFWTIMGYDRNLLFQKRFMYRTADPTDDSGFKVWPTGTTDKTAIDYAIANYVDLTGDGIDAVSGISSVASPGPYEDFTLGFVSAPFGVLFDDAAKITGAVFYIGPDRVLYYADDLTVTAPAILSDVRGAGRVQYRDMNAGLDYNDAANEALVWGAGKGSANPVFSKYTDDAAVAAHGLWQWGDIYVGASKQTTVNRRAQTYVEGSASHQRGHNEPVPVVKASVFEQGFRVGQVATFESDVFGYSEALPIRKSVITFPSPTQPRWDLELTIRVDSPFGVPDLWQVYYPPYDFDVPPIGGIDIPGPEYEFPVDEGGNLLIDHYDVDTARNVLSSRTGASSGTSHTVYLPDGPKNVGDLLVVWFAIEGDDGSTSQPFSRSIVPADPYHPDTNLPGWALWFQSNTYYEHHGVMTKFVRAGDNYPETNATMIVNTVEGSSTPLSQNGRWVSALIPVEYHDNTADGSDALRNMNYHSSSPAFPDSWLGHPSTSAQEGDDQVSLHLRFGSRGGSGSFLLGSVRTWDNIYPTANPTFPGWSLVQYQVSRSSNVPAWQLSSYIKQGANASDMDAMTFYESFSDPTYAYGSTSGLVIRLNTDALADQTLVTPGPEVTEAPWQGGNPYHRSYSTVGLLAETSNSTIYRSGTTVLTVGLYDMDRLMIDDTEYWEDPSALPGLAYGDIDPGYYHDEYPASGFSTRYWAKEEGFDDVIDGDGLDILIKWRYTGLSSIPVGARMDVYVELASIPDDQDQLDCYLLAMFMGWGNTEADTYIQSWINIWNNYNGPDGGVVWPYHSYYYDSLGPSPQVFEADTWYYTRLRIENRTAENQWGHPHVPGHSDDFHDTGHGMAMLKSWPATEEEPTSGVKGPFSWYWNGPTYDYPDVFNGEESAYTIDGWDIMLPVQWELNGWIDEWDEFDYSEYIFANHLEIRGRDAGAGRFEVDAVWRYGGGTAAPGGSTPPYTGGVEYSGEIPAFVSTQQSIIPWTSVYQTTYPYVGTTLVVHRSGLRLRAGVDYTESDPATGQFTLLEYGDQSASLYVQYSKAGLEETA